MESKNGHVNDGLPPPLIIAKSLAAGGIAGGMFVPNRETIHKAQ